VNRADDGRYDPTDPLAFIEDVTRDWNPLENTAKAIAVHCDVNRGVVLHPAQRVMADLMFRYGKRFVVADAGRRGGKTKGAAHIMTDRIYRVDLPQRLRGEGRFAHLGHYEVRQARGAAPKPSLQYWVVAPTTALLHEPMIQLQDALGLWANGGVILHQDRVKGVWWCIGNVRIDFKTGERPADLVSRSLAGLWLDEAARLKPAAWRDSLPSGLADLQGWALFTTTPIGRNWFWESVWCLCDPVEGDKLATLTGKPAVLHPFYGAVHWTTADNTTVPGLAAEVEQQKLVMPPSLWRRNFEASFDAFEGQCFPDLSRSVQTVPSDVTRDDYVRVYMGFDAGWRHNGVLAVWGERKDRQGFDEIDMVAKREFPIDTDSAFLSPTPAATCWSAVAVRLARRWKVNRFYISPEAGEADFHFQKRGLRPEAAYNERLSGLQWFQMGITAKKIRLKTSTAWRCFQGLRHPDSLLGTTEDELWLKEDDDPFDASRYALSEPIMRREGPWMLSDLARCILSV